jgi:hypothetical protein
LAELLGRLKLPVVIMGIKQGKSHALARCG